MKKIEKKKALLLISAIMVFCLSACGDRGKDTQQKTQENESDTAAILMDEQEAPKDEEIQTGENTEMSVETESGSVNKETGSHILVAYFSATGTTKKLAEYAAEVMDADLYEIVPEEPYSDADLNWNDKNSRTSIEMNDDSIKPAINGSVTDMDQYDTVFIGYPIWWGDAPHIMDTFMESYDFSGKTIIPFCTSGSSGIGSSAKELHDYTDSSVTWLDGDRLKSSLSKEDMAEWIRGLSLGIEVK